VTELDDFLRRLALQNAVLITVEATRGSAPREKGAWMAVFSDKSIGSVGGGRLEFAAQAEARQRLAGHAGATVQRYSLGPTLGQCCGGEVHLRYEPVGPADRESLLARLQLEVPPVAIFGGGHVGHALVGVLGNLPIDVRWIDSRDGVFPPALPANVQCEHSDPLQAEVGILAPNSRVLIMSFSHAEDFEVVSACLARHRLRADLPFVGLIGSRTKWSSFRQRLLARGFTAQELDHVTCPIGVAGIAGKQPEVIAVAVAAQLLQFGC
jgi:xanthine dehydrogenase accessory factor